VDSVSPLIKDVGVPHAILVKLATNCTKQHILFGAETKKVLEGDTKLQKLLSALRWLINNCRKLASYSLLKKLAGCQFLFVSRM
jgi:hypothetical protein